MKLIEGHFGIVSQSFSYGELQRNLANKKIVKHLSKSHFPFIFEDIVSLIMKDCQV